MLTLHRAALLLAAPADPTAPSTRDGAVVVQGSVIAGLGPYEELAAAFPTARLRTWDGLLTPGLLNRHGHRLLECAYHPDPREEIGDEPLRGPALAALELDGTRWGASARRGLQRMLAHGTTAVAGPFERVSVRTAVARSGLHGLHGLPGPPALPAAPGGPLDGSEWRLDPLTDRSLASLAAAAYGTLGVGGRADFAVFELSASGGPGACLATALAGRLLYRSR